MKTVILASAQPAHEYFLWQLEVQLYNIYVQKKMECKYQVILGYDEIQPTNFEFLRQKYPLVELYYYKDQRKNKSYIPSIQPHLLYQHFTYFPELGKEIFLLIDTDICFTDKELNLSTLLENDTIYMSDTSSYLDPKYVDSKGDDLLACMCSISQINELKVREKAAHHGGAQYLLKNMTASFWQKVELDSVKIYKYLTNSAEMYRSKSTSEKYTPIQAWTASMWSIIYNLIYFDYEFEVHSDLSFSWPSNPIIEWQNKSIYHNAGVVNNVSKMFFKGEFLNKRPTVDLEKLNNEVCNFKYAELVSEALNLK